MREAIFFAALSCWGFWFLYFFSAFCMNSFKDMTENSSARHLK